MSSTCIAKRLSGAIGVAVYVMGTSVAPLVHIVTEHGPTSVAAESVDPEAFRDRTTGHVDLTKLAAALGLGAHDESVPHSHSPGERPGNNPLDHGRGSVEHFGVALLGVAALSVVFVEAAPAPAAPTIPSAPEPAQRLRHLEAQRAQAPPV